MTDDLAHWGGPPAGADEQAEADRLARFLEGETGALPDGELRTVCAWLDEFVIDVLSQAGLSVEPAPADDVPLPAVSDRYAFRLLLADEGTYRTWLADDLEGGGPVAIEELADPPPALFVALDALPEVRH